VLITHGKTHDVNVLDTLPIEVGAFYVMDRGYLDFGRLHRFTLGLAFFVTRAKTNLDFSRRSSRRVDKTTGLRSDQTIVLNGPKTSVLYPDSLRRISYRDLDTGKRFVFLTNNFDLPALTIAKIYKSRWQIELFFRWIKQHLRIKSFFGTSPNAVKTQVWIGICVYVLVAIVRKELKVERSLGEILQILSVSLFEKTPVFEALSLEKLDSGDTTDHKQLPLFDL
jgi:IS4 transposase